MFTNIFLKASSVAGLITTIGKEAGKEEFKQAFLIRPITFTLLLSWKK